MDPFQKKFLKKRTTILINGQQYDSLDDVPERYRALLQDHDGDGVPDIVQARRNVSGGAPSISRIEMRSVNGVTTYWIGDREYHSLAEVPVQYRAMFQDHDGDGLPDGLTGLRGVGRAGHGEPPVMEGSPDPTTSHAVERSAERPTTRSTVGHRPATGRGADFEFVERKKVDGVFLLIVLGGLAVFAIVLAIGLAVFK